MVDRPNTTPFGQDRKSLTFKALLYLNVTVHAQVCRLFCVVYMPLFSLVQARPWFRSSMWISSVAGISKILCTSEVAGATRTMWEYNVRHKRLGTKFSCVDRKMCGFNWQKPQMIIYAKLQSSRVRHQYGIFSGKSQTSFTRNATRAGSEEGRLFSQANT